MNAFIKKKIIDAIDWYQKTVSPDHGTYRRATCRFTPTCSEYGREAIMKHGTKGLFMASWRIIRCNGLMTKSGTVEQVPDV